LVKNRSLYEIKRSTEARKVATMNSLLDTPKWALVTGASSGIGAELAKALARRKISLVLTARRVDRLEQLRTELIRQHGVEVAVIAHDLNDPRSGEKLCAELDRRGLRVSILINNAGFGWYGEFIQQSPQEIESLLHVNVIALTALTRQLAPAMAERGTGRVLNVASMIAFTPASRMALYSASKAYVMALSQSLDLELQPRGVRVSVLCPGFTETEFNDVADWPKSGLMKVLMLKAPHVAEAGIAGLLRGKRVIVPGWHYKLTALIVHFLPRRVMLRLAAMTVKSD
jgi:short-subunit dehydrogenase